MNNWKLEPTEETLESLKREKVRYQKEIGEAHKLDGPEFVARVNELVPKVNALRAQIRELKDWLAKK